jgi:hypothetical protein
VNGYAVFAFVLPVPMGCGLSSGALTGLVHDDGAAFHFSTSAYANCPTMELEAGSITSDGQVVPEEAFRRGGGGGFERGCDPPGVTVVAAEGPPRDGGLTVELPGGHASYLGELVFSSPRSVRFVDLDIYSRRRAGDSITLEYSVPTDEITRVSALFSGSQAAEIDIEAATIVVRIPDDVRSGAQSVQVRVDAEVPTLECEGFATCSLTVITGGRMTFSVDET